MNRAPSSVNKADRRSSIRADLDVSAVTGAPMIGCLIGLHRVSVEGRPFALALDPGRPALHGGTGVVEIAALADLTLGGAIRDSAKRSLPLPTISMTVQLDGQTKRPVLAAAAAQVPRASSAAASGELLDDDGRVVGRAQALFAVPNRTGSAPVAPMPWDEWDPPQEDPAASTRTGTGPTQDADRTISSSSGGTESIVEQLQEHVDDSPSSAWASSLVKRRLQLLRPGVAELPPIPVSTNRGGHIHGGLLFGLAVLSNPSVHDFEDDDFVSATMDFIGPGSPQHPLEVHTELLHSTKRTGFCDVRIAQAGTLIARATTVFRR